MNQLSISPVLGDVPEVVAPGVESAENGEELSPRLFGKSIDKRGGLRGIGRGCTIMAGRLCKE